MFDVGANVGWYSLNALNQTFIMIKSGGGAFSLLNIQDKDDIDKIEVDMMTMDEWAKKNQISRVDFIKCDVEGAELFVYKGGMEIIENSKPLIFSEMLRKWSAKFGYHPNDIIDLLA